MTKIRGSVILAGAVGPSSTKTGGMMYIRAPPPWGKKAVVLANIPRTAFRPTAGQDAWRKTFANAAHEAKRQGYSQLYDSRRNLPGTAAYIKDTLDTGKTAARRAEHRWKGEYNYGGGISTPEETGARVYPRTRRYRY